MLCEREELLVDLREVSVRRMSLKVLCRSRQGNLHKPRKQNNSRACSLPLLTGQAISKGALASCRSVKGALLACFS